MWISGLKDRKKPNTLSLFTEALQTLGQFPPEHIEEIEKEAEIREIGRQEILLNPGEVCSSCFFVEKGAVYQYLVDEDNEKQVLDLHSAGDWVLNAQSFTQRKPSDSYIEAYEDSQVFELNIHSIHSLIDRLPSMFQLGKILGVSEFRTNLLEKRLSPKEKYEYLLQNRPQLLQDYPLYMIASFLKISPETLSRIRGR